MKPKTMTEQLKEVIDKLPRREVRTSVGGMELIENAHIPEHLVMMSVGENLYVTNMLTGEVTKVPKWDWSLMHPLKFEGGGSDA